MKLFRFKYSGYARKVQMLLDLLGVDYEMAEVPYSDRRELAQLTGGYIYVPVLLMNDGRVIVESRRICEQLLASEVSHSLCPAPLDGPIWGYADFCDGPLEDVLFRLASPAVREAWADAGDRALYTLIKERKFGAGCVDLWREQSASLFERARELLRPTLRTLQREPFLFGSKPTLADAALYGMLAMLREADPRLIEQLEPSLDAYCVRVEAAAAKARAAA
jgi:glutathione S-transferase